ncbi:MAG TPA: type II secretion system protein [Candidatus Paceibacterota bacterium]|nr:type II secretion system protein [Candidatus Paceibacterota bacterium]
MKNRFRGFTLIELLVVIAIIGILSAVVLASLNTARQKGNDAAVESDLNTVRTQAEIYYGDNSNSFGTLTWSTGAACTTAAASMFSDPVILQAMKSAYADNGQGNIACATGSAGQSFIVAAALTAAANTWWCTDSTGASKLESGTNGTFPASAITTCP